MTGGTLSGVTVSWLFLLAACGATSSHDANKASSTGGIENASSAGGRDHTNVSGAGGTSGSTAASRGQGGSSIPVAGSGPTIDVMGGSGGAISNRTPVACENPQENPYGGGFLICAQGLITRPSASRCNSTWPRPEAADPLIGADCVHDADCVAEPYGICAYGDCTYGNCLSDDDCGEGRACFCRDPIGVCSPALCLTDADCEPGYPCTSANQGTLGPQVFACQRADGQCLFSTDCTGLSACLVQLVEDSTVLVGARVCVPIPG